jgi:ABC-type polysaccharide/polyol phosphate export permease
MSANGANAGVVRSLLKHRSLVAVLVERELKARYRGTLLGYVWSLINPLLLIAVYAVVFTLVIPARIKSPVPYPLFLFAGVLPWLFATGALLDSAVVLPDNGPLLKKVVCPPEVFPAVTVCSHLVHHLLALPILLAVMLSYTFAGRMTFPWTVVLLPLVLALWVVTFGGLSLAVAALAVHFRDLKDLLHNVLNLLFFMSPIIYMPDSVPEGLLRNVVLANPVTPLVVLYRGVAVEGHVPQASWWGWAIVVAGVSWMFGAFVFSRLRDSIAETV